MPRKLPPLKALRAFEATARQGSFTRAAEELGVTQGAVSKQISLLEEHLGIRLLTRNGRQVTLTPQGEAYLPRIASVFDALEEATDEITSRDNRIETLTINILPSLSSRWLMPMLEDFRRRHPGISVRVTIGDGPADFATLDADIAIRSGRRNNWKQLHAELLMEEELVPVCRPSLLEASPVKRPADLMRHTLLQHTCRPEIWEEYLASLGIRNPKVKHDLGLEHFFILIEAALDGLGVALIPRILIGRELSEGSLVACGKRFKSPYSYYFICPRRTLELKKLRRFRQWLLARTAAGEAASPRRRTLP